jgi:RNA polymerase sigma-70 factor, ECF subfamily
MTRDLAPKSPSDEELACRAQQGCVASFEQLLRRFQTPVLQFLRHRGSLADAEDLTQETFLRAFEKLHHYDRRWTFAAWLFTIARRTSINHGRRTRPVADGAAVAAAADTAPEPLETLVAAESRRRLWDIAAEVLAEESMTAIWLRYAEEMSLGEISKVLGRSPASVKIMLFRARRELMPYLGEFEANRQPSTLTSAKGGPYA